MSYFNTGEKSALEQLAYDRELYRDELAELEGYAMPPPAYSVMDDIQSRRITV